MSFHLLVFVVKQTMRITIPYEGLYLYTTIVKTNISGLREVDPVAQILKVSPIDSRGTTLLA